MADRIAYAQPQAGGQGFARTMKTFGGAVALVVADMVTGNTVELLQVPRGFVLTGVYLALTDIDSNGTPTVAVTLGDLAVPARLVASSTIGQAGGSTTTLAATGLYYQYLADTNIALTFGTGSATAAAGTATCYLTGFMA
ncbi:hypothetical protein [Rhizobium tubonense]|uniref:Uncharacterized protein n=1 Tax=Rhizobium tubonense TaxID=484088 RepID=A0A2W4DTW2_9HYPH|nr:hypothetical protein [Rhizobium tubonense]PZM07586.1 hypothetical protein CPY51_31140 [Rhizobium tubonense]